MAHVPQCVIDQQHTLPHLRLAHRGKVRDSYELPDHPDKMLVVASDRVSIFDFVLPALIPDKGAVLTAMNHFWTRRLEAGGFRTDFCAAGAAVDEYLPTKLRGNPELQQRATVVQKVELPPVEHIVRLYLTGSGWESYQKNGTVCGHTLPVGLRDGDPLPSPLYTPTTKAEIGHDEHITADYVLQTYGPEYERWALAAAGYAAKYARERGIILADTKFEGSAAVIADEKLTPDSSRYWDARAWEQAKKSGTLPPSFDKQFVREWGKTQGIHKLDPEHPEHLATVDALVVPEKVCEETTAIYRKIFLRLTDYSLEKYQQVFL